MTLLRGKLFFFYKFVKFTKPVILFSVIEMQKGVISNSLLAKSRFIGFVILAALLAVGCKKKSSPPAPPEVQFITATPTNVPIFEEWIGTLDGLVNAQIRAQVTGYLLTQDYTEGSEVKKGDVLFQIDPRPFQAVLDQTKSRLAQDQAQFDKTQLDVKRYAPLAKEQAVSQQELDDAVQGNLAAQAQVKADDATIESAQLNLSFTKIGRRAKYK
jgi:multidrug efflux pump subunit AcrA (membrane-fusion protein)